MRNRACLRPAAGLAIAVVLAAVTGLAVDGTAAAARDARKDAPGATLSPAQSSTGGPEGIQGNRTVLGVVRKVTGDQIEVNIGEVSPRFLPLRQAREKGFGSVKRGDRLRIVLNEQNLLVDYHPVDQQSDHQVVQGRIAAPLVIGHGEAVIRLGNGQEEMYPVRSMARSKMASIPVGTEVLILLDESKQIADVTFDKDAIAAQKEAASIKSPLKGAHERIAGTIVSRLRADRIRIRTDGGHEEGYEVRPAVQPKLARLGEGEAVILLVDDERKVIDVALPPRGEGKGRG